MLSKSSWEFKCRFEDCKSSFLSLAPTLSVIQMLFYSHYGLKVWVAEMHLVGNILLPNALVASFHLCQVIMDFLAERRKNKLQHAWFKYSMQCQTLPLLYMAMLMFIDVISKTERLKIGNIIFWGHLQEFSRCDVLKLLY